MRCSCIHTRPPPTCIYFSPGRRNRRHEMTTTWTVLVCIIIFNRKKRRHSRLHVAKGVDYMRLVFELLVGKFARCRLTLSVVYAMKSLKRARIKSRHVPIIGRFLIPRQKNCTQHVYNVYFMLFCRLFIRYNSSKAKVRLDLNYLMHKLNKPSCFDIIKKCFEMTLRHSDESTCNGFSQVHWRWMYLGLCEGIRLRWTTELRLWF